MASTLRLYNASSQIVTFSSSQINPYTYVDFDARAMFGNNALATELTQLAKSGAVNVLLNGIALEVSQISSILLSPEEATTYLTLAVVPPVATVTELRSVFTSQFVGNSAQVLVTGVGSIYVFDSTSTTADNGSTVIRPNDRPTTQPGRWLVGMTGGSAPSGVTVQDEGVSLPGSYSVLNFVGAGVTAADAGGGTTTITIPGSAGPVALAGDLSGNTSAATVIRLQGRALSSSAPTNGQAIVWNNGASEWQPTTLTVSGTAGGDLSGTYPNPTVVDLTIASEAHGDLLYRAASAWQRLAPGTSGYALTTQGPGAAPVWSPMTSGSITIGSSTLSGGGTASSFTLNVLYGTTSNTALEGTNDALYVKLAGSQTITGAKTFNSQLIVGTTGEIRSDTGLGPVQIYVFSGGTHEFGENTAPWRFTAGSSLILRANTNQTRIEMSASTILSYVGNSLRATTSSGFHVGLTNTSRSSGEISAQTRFIVGTGAADASSVLDLQSTSRGALFPRMTTTQRNAISSPATSLLIFNTTTNQHEWYNGTSWQPLGSTYGIPVYYAGPAGSGPGGSSPQFAEPQDAIAYAVSTDGHNADTPFAVHVFPGQYSTRVQMVSGCHLIGVHPDPDSTVLGGGLEYTFATDGTYGPTDVDYAFVSNVVCVTSDTTIPLYVQPTGNKDTAVLFVDGVIAGAGGSAAFGCRVETNLVNTGIYGYLKNVTVGSGGTAAFRVNGAYAWITTDYIYASDNGTTTQPPAVDAVGDSSVFIAPGKPTTQTIYGPVVSRGTNTEVVLFPGVNVLTANVSGVNTVFDVRSSGLLKILGNHVFGGFGDYLFDCTSGVGEVQAGGSYSLIGTTSGYKSAAGISLNGYYIVHPERVQLITTDDTVDRDTTLAIFDMADDSPHNVNLPDPEGWNPGHKLRCKNISTLQSDVTLVATSSVIDGFITSLPFTDGMAFHFAAYADNLIILSSHSP